MRPIRALLALPVMIAAPPALADVPAERTIQVTGTAAVRTPPGIALLVAYLRGEGATPEAATRAIADKQRAVGDGVAGFLGAGAEISTSEVIVIEARGAGCTDQRGYGSQPRLSSGDCAVVGYIATMQTSVRTPAVDKAATAAALAARLGASDARVTGFLLTDPQAAQARANAAAFEDARRRASALAGGAGVRLGPITSVRDQASYDQVMYGAMQRAAVPPPPPPPAPPAVSTVTLDTRPAPIETRAQVYVTYAIAG
ncbi:SIMPL domain-containing protein [Sphingomonas sp. RHCKR7]|uniref:SIMPL domain-containing protein n=1 Tax=Sphingomonas folli TaxID=2862497 RepID=UPI001CA5D8A4|nr:SIMPL domain-containing protein [Sphingomonas folli]MBW6526976.1 SIMPL domain-containing protein [Sphingomonas folli]